MIYALRQLIISRDFVAGLYDTEIKWLIAMHRSEITCNFRAIVIIVPRRYTDRKPEMITKKKAIFFFVNWKKKISNEKLFLENWKKKKNVLSFLNCSVMRYIRPWDAELRQDSLGIILMKKCLISIYAEVFTYYRHEYIPVIYMHVFTWVCRLPIYIGMYIDMYYAKCISDPNT